MPIHLRALVVLLVFAFVMFSMARRAATEYAMWEGDFDRRRILWFAITLLAFLSHNFWLLIILSGLLLVYAGRDEPNLLGLYLLVVLLVPPIPSKIPGFGIINQLLEFDFSRFLCLFLLFPAMLRARQEVRRDGDGWYVADVCLLIYILVQLALRVYVDTLTNTMRYGLYALLDVWLPYYVASRSLRNAAMFRDAIMCFLLTAMFFAIVAVFESVRHWLLYTDLPSALGIKQWGLGNYLSRVDLLRAQATTGQPIVLGYIFVIALSLYAIIYRYIVQHRTIWWLGFILLFGGLIAALSRGPWVGAAIALVVFRISGPKAVGGMMKSGLVVAGLVGIVMMSPLRDTFIDYLPFVGTVEAENVEYRQRLMQASVQIILQNPWFGTYDYMYQLIDQDLVIGGMVDIVNTYVGVGLGNGLTGLFAFVGVFFFAGVGIVRSMAKLPDPECEERTIGQGLLAALVGTAVTIATVSSISFIPLLYWLVAGLAVGYSGMVRRKIESMSVPAVAESSPLRTRQGTAAGRARTA